MTWRYVLDDESIRDERDNVIGHVEPASGPLAAAAPGLLAACMAALSLRGSAEQSGAQHELGMPSAKADARCEAIEAQILAAIAEARGGA